MSRIDQALRRTNQYGPAREAVADDLPGFEAYPAGELRRDPIEPPAPDAEWPEHVSIPHSILDESLIVHEPVPRICTEQFRALAGALHEKQRETGIKTLMITSAHAHEGKTFTAANLALMLSESYRRRVLLIDADLRRPSVHTILKVPNEHGLADGLKRGSEQAVRATELSQWLAVLPGGTADPDPMPSLTSGRIKPIIDDAASRFDWVIIDTPPVALLPDASLLAPLVQGIVMVVGAGLTSYRTVGRAMETLGRNKVVGVVLNRVQLSLLPDASYDHYYGLQKGEREPKRRFFGLIAAEVRTRQ